MTTVSASKTCWFYLPVNGNDSCHLPHLVQVTYALIDWLLHLPSKSLTQWLHASACSSYRVMATQYHSIGGLDALCSCNGVTTTFIWIELLLDSCCVGAHYCRKCARFSFCWRAHLYLWSCHLFWCRFGKLVTRNALVTIWKLYSGCFPEMPWSRFESNIQVAFYFLSKLQWREAGGQSAVWPVRATEARCD